MMPKKPVNADSGRKSKPAIILKAARRLFLEQGFAGTSMDAVTALAGVSKPTVYHHFPTKEALLEAVIRGEAEASTGPADLAVSADLRHDLEQAATWLMGVALASEALAWNRMIAGESRRKPELGRLIFEHGPQQWLKRLTRFLRALDEAGGLEILHPDQAAEFFFGLVVGVPLVREQLSGVSLTASQVRSRSQAAAERFARAYAPAAKPGEPRG